MRCAHDCPYKAKTWCVPHIGEQYFSLGQRTHSPTHLLWSHWLLGLTLFHLGEVVPSREHLEQGVPSMTSGGTALRLSFLAV